GTFNAARIFSPSRWKDGNPDYDDGLFLECVHAASDTNGDGIATGADRQWIYYQHNHRTPVMDLHSPGLERKPECESGSVQAACGGGRSDRKNSCISGYSIYRSVCPERSCTYQFIGFR